MSVEDLKKYGQMCLEDEALKAKAKTLGLDIDKHIAHGKELGLEFGAEDLKALGEETGFSEDELTEEQLEMVAGGVALATGVVLAGAALGALVGAVVGGVSVGGGVGAAVLALEEPRSGSKKHTTAVTLVRRVILCLIMAACKW